VEMGAAMKFYLVEDVAYDPAAAKKFLTPEMREPFRRLIEMIGGLEMFNEENLERVFRQVVVEEMGLKLGKIAQPVRVALTGSTMSPGLFEIIDILGKDAVLKRLRRAMENF
ncbi:MAG: glutamate--tRNA ligase, partial [Syntrophobacteraceae bacterium]